MTGTRSETPNPGWSWAWVCFAVAGLGTKVCGLQLAISGPRDRAHRPRRAQDAQLLRSVPSWSHDAAAPPRGQSSKG